MEKFRITLDGETYDATGELHLTRVRPEPPPAPEPDPGAWVKIYERPGDFIVVPDPVPDDFARERYPVRVPPGAIALRIEWTVNMPRWPKPSDVFNPKGDGAAALLLWVQDAREVWKGGLLSHAVVTASGKVRMRRAFPGRDLPDPVETSPMPTGHAARFVWQYETTSSTLHGETSPLLNDEQGPPIGEVPDLRVAFMNEADDEGNEGAVPGTTVSDLIVLARST